MQTKILIKKIVYFLNTWTQALEMNTIAMKENGKAFIEMVNLIRPKLIQWGW